MVTDTWGLNPTSLIAALQSILKIPAKNEKNKQEGDVVDRLVSPINSFTKLISLFLYNMIQLVLCCNIQCFMTIDLFIFQENFEITHSNLSKICSVQRRNQSCTYINYPQI